MNEGVPTPPLSTVRSVYSRRRLLTIPPLVAAAYVLAPKPARANERTIECLADLGAF
jgi:hypothetical protein